MSADCMSDDPEVIATLRARVERCRRANVAALVLFPALVLLAAWSGPAATTQDTLRTARLEILDAAGQVAMRLSAGDRGGLLEILAAVGSVRLRLGADASGNGELQLLNADDVTVARLGATAEGFGEVRVADRDGDLAGRLFAHHEEGGEKGGGILELNDPMKRRTVYLGPGHHGDGMLATFAAGRPVVQAHGDSEGNGVLTVAGSGGFPAIKVGSDSVSGFIQCNDGSGRRIAYLGGGGRDGKDGALVLSHGSGERLIYAGAAPDGSGLLQVSGDGVVAVSVGVREDGDGYVSVKK